MSVPLRIFAVVLALVASTAFGNSHLTRSEAISISDAKVRHVLHYDLHDYERYSISYSPVQRNWRIEYRHKKSHSNEFTVRIDDVTKNAVVWMP